ncbi:MAG: translation initiation factor, partial [Rhodococcus sp. (in: high G+C Gram-positive bacteria)]
MPPRRRSTPTGSLTPENLESLAHALAEGKRATVYLIEPTPSLALPEGTSAKVVSIDGNTVTIRPKGVDDELPFEADELRITRNPPASPAKPSAAKPAASKPASRPAAKVAPRVASPTPTPTPS